ncbi:hypothetical protein [Leifsonia sp. 2MCAF36]|uniref:hypothetical protein n=1 Tax=Leifsonia sp. 2MCAF36 TaxID=3232988 RepID=UPI003F99695A
MRKNGAVIAVGMAAVLMAALGTTLTGCAGSEPDAIAATSAATASPTPIPSGTPYDLSVQRTFILSDGSTAPGCVQVSVVPDPQTDDGTSADRIKRARALILSRNWDAEPVSLDELSADERQHEKDRGETEGEMLAGVLSDHISKAVTDAKLMGTGVSLRGHVGC